MPDLKASNAEAYARKSPWRPSRTSASRPPPRRSRGVRRWRTRPAGARGTSPARPGDADRAARAAARHPGGVQPERQRRLLGLRALTTASDPTGCVTEPAGTVFNGPLHNQIPNPANDRARQQHLWVPDFSPDYYSKLIFSTRASPRRCAGTSRRREPQGPDRAQLLPGGLQGAVRPRGRGDRLDPGPALRGVVLRRHLRGRFQSDQGHPDNPRGDNQIAVDALEALAKAQPGFDWASYDVEDQQDVDGDGDLFEPNGVARPRGRRARRRRPVRRRRRAGHLRRCGRTPRSSTRPTAATRIGGTGFKVFNVTYQPEDAEAGVIAHEFGHDLGLPDLYDIVGRTEPDTASGTS